MNQLLISLRSTHRFGKKKMITPEGESFQSQISPPLLSIDAIQTIPPRQEPLISLGLDMLDQQCGLFKSWVNNGWERQVQPIGGVWWLWQVANLKEGRGEVSYSRALGHKLFYTIFNRTKHLRKWGNVYNNQIFFFLFFNV